jgi:hypothetical protein
MINSVLRVSVLLMIVLIAAPGAFAQAWPDVFNPFQILNLNLQLAEQDWDTIRHDTTNEIEVPALFWADGESPILVSVRRKSSRALPSEADPVKVGLKIDINELVDGQKWRDLTKVSLENGTDSGVIPGRTCLESSPACQQLVWVRGCVCLVGPAPGQRPVDWRFRQR